MRSLIETAVLITGCGSATCWFASAMWHLPSIKPGIDELAKVTELSNRLGRRADGRNCLTVSVGKISRMNCLIKRSGVEFDPLSGFCHADLRYVWTPTIAVADERHGESTHWR